MPTAYWTITSICWVVFWVYWTFAGLRKRPARRKVALLFTIFNTALLYLGFVLILLGRTISAPFALLFLPEALPLAVIGTIFTILGVAFAMWSRTSLSTNWSGQVAITEGQQVILAAISLWQKARREEQLLAIEFGAQYANYQREVKFLIPWLY